MTLAVYHTTANGVIRLGTFSVQGHPNMRRISAAFRRRQPNLDPNTVSFAKRIFLFGRWMDDSDRLPMELD